MSNWFHGTSEQNAQYILRNGFKEGNGKFGRGIYFAKEPSTAIEYSSSFFDPIMITATIEDTNIKQFTFEDLCEIFPALCYEEDIAEMREFILNLGFKTASVEFEDKTVELVVYDNSVIENIKTLDVED